MGRKIEEFDPKASIDISFIDVELSLPNGVCLCVGFNAKPLSDGTWSNRPDDFNDTNVYYPNRDDGVPLSETEAEEFLNSIGLSLAAIRAYLRSEGMNWQSC